MIETEISIVKLQKRDLLKVFLLQITFTVIWICNYKLFFMAILLSFSLKIYCHRFRSWINLLNWSLIILWDFYFLESRDDSLGKYMKMVPLETTVDYIMALSSFSESFKSILMLDGGVQWIPTRCFLDNLKSENLIHLFNPSFEGIPILLKIIFLFGRVPLTKAPQCIYQAKLIPQMNVKNKSRLFLKTIIQYLYYVWYDGNCNYQSWPGPNILKWG